MKPILFNTAMVQAILSGQKTTTRRIIKDVDNNYLFLGTCEETDKTGLSIYTELFRRNSTGLDLKVKIPYGVREILYVRETWQITNPMGDTLKGEGTAEYVYKAGYAKGKRVHIIASQEKNLGVWKPSIHMPKDAARIFLKITDVRVERLKDIDYEGVKHEGVKAGYDGWIKEWSALWDSTVNKKDIDKYGWKANPYVWVIEFERCDKPNEK